MKNKIYFLLLLSTLLNACNSDFPKETTIHSRSKAESLKRALYIGEYNLICLQGLGKCKDLNVSECWAETAATVQNNFLFFPKWRKLDFNNVFLKVNNDDSTSNYAVMYKIENEWEVTSCIEEPKLGFYIQIDQKIPIDSVKIKVITSVDSCFYVLVKKP